MGLRTLHVTTIDLTAHCFLRSTFDLLRRQGHEVALACDFQQFQSELTEHTDRMFQVKIPRQIRPFQDLRGLAQMIRVIRLYKPDLLHSHTSKAGFTARLAARLCDVPLVVHTIHELPQNATRSRLKKTLYWAMEKLAAGWCDHLITVSRVNREQILRERICRPEKLSLIPGGLQLQNYQGGGVIPWTLPADAIVMGMAGRLEAAKGHEDLLRAFARLAPQNPRLHLVVMGTGHLRGQLEQLRDDLGLQERAHFLGWVEDLVSAMAALDLFVLSSHYEGLGVVLLEALALGRPVVSTRVGGTQDIIEDGVTGLFAPAHDPAGLARAVQRLLDDPALAARLAAAGKEKVWRDYSAVDADQKVLELYLRLTGRASRP
ncbi:MAG: glycosyltransferase family 4 protein [Candidatus Eremiobacteraeota bacterium]|nr:glycosyltransferase family 4 protein [Candidatus Eremiobacteraeota bacterium]